MVTDERGLFATFAPSYVPDVYYIYGWSDHVLRYFASMNQSRKIQTDHIMAMTI